MANKFTDAVFNADLPMLEKSVLNVLAHRSNNETGECWTSYSGIARYAGMARSSAEKGVKALLDRGLISIVGRREVRAGKQVNIYKLNLEKIAALAITARRYVPLPESGIGDAPIPGDGIGPVPLDGAASTGTRSLTHPSNSSISTHPEQGGTEPCLTETETETERGTNLGETPNPHKVSAVLEWAKTKSNGPWKNFDDDYLVKKFPVIEAQYDKFHRNWKKGSRPHEVAAVEDEEKKTYYELHGHHRYQAETVACEVCKEEDRRMRTFLEGIVDIDEPVLSRTQLESNSFIIEEDDVA